MTRSHLYAIHYSPWSERARWALDYHGVRYRYHEHVPFLGERLLRFRARRAKNDKATAPLYVKGTEAISDSYDILLHADAVGANRPLLADPEATLALRRDVDRALDSARSRATARVLADAEALRESAMAVSPAFLAGAFRPLAAHGARYLGRKHGMDLSNESKHVEALRIALARIRDALNGERYLMAKRFSAADILASNVIQGVAPVDAPHMKLQPASHRAWACPELADEFSDLVTWRDELYTAHRF
ncbi:MAG: glutathione S-transferase N-terminal domain-containing protein [Myxococcota bacterium]